MPAKRKLESAQLQRAALALVDREGLPALSMRSLARELGTGTMTLYGYLRDRDALDDLVVEAVVAEVVPAGVAEAAPWREAVHAIAMAVWQAVAAHPNTIPLILTNRVRQAATLPHAEAMLAALARGGLAGESLLAAFRAINGYILGAAQTHEADLRDASGQAARIAVARGLQEAAYPRMREIAAAAAGMPPARQFEAGLQLVLAGIASVAGEERESLS